MRIDAHRREWSSLARHLNLGCAVSGTGDPLRSRLRYLHACPSVERWVRRTRAREPQGSQRREAPLSKSPRQAPGSWLMGSATERKAGPFQAGQGQEPRRRGFTCIVPAGGYNHDQE